MNLRNYSALIFVTGTLLISIGCNSKKHADPTSFTKIDSLTDTYLALQDSMVDTWNMMIKDDNKKIRAMRSLIHELEIGGQYAQGELKSYEQRVEQLSRIRYTPKTMWNTDVIEEYDFASKSLVTELVALAESYTAFSYNTTLQKLVEEIRTADLRVENYRSDYDSIALQYNTFIEENHELLKEIADNGTLEKKPLFQVAAE